MLKQRLIGLFFIGLLIFNYPILTLFDRPVLFLKVPLIYLYLFSAWFLLIFLAYLAVKPKKDRL